MMGRMKTALQWILLTPMLLAGIPAAAQSKAETAQTAEAEIQIAPKEVEGVRDVTLRHFEPGKDREAMKRIHYFKSRLPVEVRDRNNFAWAKADIKGLRKKEYYAHSRVQSISNFSWRARRKIRGISPHPPQETAQFETLCVDFKGNIGGPNAIPRHYDTEYKIMEDIAARLGTNTAVQGSILLYTDLEPCVSCRGVMRQFLALYTNVEMEVLYDWP